MENDHPRWRLHLSTVMLLVMIAGLASYIAVLQYRERQARLEAELMRAVAEFERAAATQQAKARMPVATGPTE